ncbi:hypothetical protein H0H81_002887 [Sphagnurus paluster]|uniref:Uncharacterized protein n=1 Tax=Sphagnurus paluster TaxID=117069 RepID=A0A9P7FS83_9AGAR|nr:hypothetical protein H0H81_002887 [Sphagnurus paluster]
MGGKKWTSDDQREWLETKLMGFLEARSKGKVANFLRAVCEDWFTLWPERDLIVSCGDNNEDTQCLANAIKARKEQIHQWLLRNVRKETRSSALDFKKLMHIVDKGRSTVRKRKYQPVEVYQKYFGDKVSDTLKEAFDKGEVSTRGERMGLRRKVCTKAFEDEEEDIRALVAERLSS